MKYSLAENINRLICFDFEYMYTSLVNNEIQRRREAENKKSGGSFSR